MKLFGAHTKLWEALNRSISGTCSVGLDYIHRVKRKSIEFCHGDARCRCSDTASGNGYIAALPPHCTAAKRRIRLQSPNLGSAAPARADTNATNGMLFIFAAMAATTLHQNLRADPIRDVAVPGSAGAQPRNRLLPCRP
jgi:hypothetical protein